MKKIKIYDVVYRQRRNKDGDLFTIVLEGANADSIKSQFWKKVQKFDRYGNPLLTIVSIKLRKYKEVKMSIISIVSDLAIEHVLDYIEAEFGDSYSIENLPYLNVEYDGEIFELDYAKVHDSSWVSDGKYEYKDLVYAIQISKEGVIYDTDKYIKQTLVRSGSYYSEWAYFNEVPIQVERKTRIVEEVYYE